jgi:methylglutaconyl-CoA hydratase
MSGADGADVVGADVVRVEVAKGVMTATLTDVENRNALGAELIRGLRDAIEAANADPAIRALVVTNEGNVFCAGANLKQRSGASTGGKKGASGSGGFEDLLFEIQTSATPIVGRIAGHVVGGGNGLASALDISIASEDVKFGFTEVRLGVVPAIISVVCLPKMRPGEAMEAFLRGNRFPASRAAELGLINRAVPAAELDAAVDEVLSDLRKGGPNALGIAKRLVYEVPRLEQKDAFPWTAKLSNELFSGEEAAEGMKAFLGKRPAAWAAVDED